MHIFRWQRTTDDAYIFTVTTVMYSPATMATVSDGVLRTTAVHVIQQYGTSASSEHFSGAYSSSTST